MFGVDFLAKASWAEVFWLTLGFAGQLLFTGRFLVQWIASEKERSSVVPMSFWWLSIAGGGTMLLYAFHRRDPVYIVGQLTGVIVYARNIALIKQKAARELMEQAPTFRATPLAAVRNAA